MNKPSKIDFQGMWHSPHLTLMRHLLAVLSLISILSSTLYPND